MQDLPVTQSWLSQISRQLAEGEPAVRSALHQYLQCADSPDRFDPITAPAQTSCSTRLGRAAERPITKCFLAAIIVVGDTVLLSALLLRSGSCLVPCVRVTASFCQRVCQHTNQHVYRFVLAHAFGSCVHCACASVAHVFMHETPEMWASRSSASAACTSGLDIVRGVSGFT